LDWLGMSRAEEVGLRGSQAIAESYYQQNKVVVGMMQLDMTFYPGGPQPVVGIMVGTSAITRLTDLSLDLEHCVGWVLIVEAANCICVFGCADYVNANLTEFTRELVETYSNLPWVDTACGYGCSDHASWHKMGYRATMPAEAKFRDSNPCALSSLLSLLTFEGTHLTRSRDRHSHGGGHARSREPCTRPRVRQDRSRSHCRARSHRVHELGRVEQQHSPLLSHISLSLSLVLFRINVAKQSTKIDVFG